MSVKSKVKRCNLIIENQNIKINNLQEQIENLNTQLRIAQKHKNGNKLLENIIKFAITNHIGNLRGGMMVDAISIEKMKDLKLDIERSLMEDTYIMRVRY